MLDCMLTTVRLPSVASADITISASSSELPRWGSRGGRGDRIGSSVRGSDWDGAPHLDPRDHRSVTRSRRVTRGTAVARALAMRHFLFLACVSVGCSGSTPAGGGDDMQ